MAEIACDEYEEGGRTKRVYETCPSVRMKVIATRKGPLMHDSGEVKVLGEMLNPQLAVELGMALVAAGKWANGDD